MQLRDLLPHASTLVEVVQAWKVLGWFPGRQLGAVTFGWIALGAIALLWLKLLWLLNTT